MTTSADSPVPAPSVGHVCEGSPNGRKPGLCWICGQALPHDCVGGAHVQPSQVSAIVQAWLDKHGHERCWYYPELFNQLAVTLGLTQRAPSGLPFIEEFKEGCRRYQAEEYHLEPAVSALVTHGPPQKVDTIAAKLIEQKKELAAALFSEPANRLAPPIAATGRKWPIGTLDEHAYAQHTWAHRLQQARTHRGLTLDALARRLDPPRTRKDISAMEHGRRGLSVELCAQLADALDCDRLWLAGWTL